MKWDWVLTPSGEKTVILKKTTGEILLHSKYNPKIEAGRWVTQWEIEKNSPKQILVIGLGAGYHIEELARKFPHLKINVWEFNPQYASWLANSGSINYLQESFNIKIYVSDNIHEIKNNFLPLLDSPDNMVLLHSPSLELIPKKLTFLKELLKTYIIHLRTMRRHGEELDKNFKLNLSLKDNGISEWKDNLLNKGAILISAGPSLTKQLPYLKEIYQNENIFLACVGTALKPLLNSGIKPNIVMISDPQDNIMAQFIDNFNIDIPMFYLATANHSTIKRYRGPRFIVWQKGFTKSMEQAQLTREPLIKTGGSVATCLLDLLVWMGCSKIALVGQDLAFTDGYSHAKGTHDFRKVNSEGLIKIQDYYQKEIIKTSNNLFIYLKWFEMYSMSLTKKIELWNCTEGGAFIPGWLHRNLRHFISTQK